MADKDAITKDYMKDREIFADAFILHSQVKTSLGVNLAVPGINEKELVSLDC